MVYPTQQPPCSSSKSQQSGLNDPLKYNNAKHSILHKSSSLFRQTRSDILSQLSALWSIQNRILIKPVGRKQKGKSHLCTSLFSVLLIHNCCGTTFVFKVVFFRRTRSEPWKPQQHPKSLGFTSNVWITWFKNTALCRFMCSNACTRKRLAKAVLCTSVQREVSQYFLHTDKPECCGLMYQTF